MAHARRWGAVTAACLIVSMVAAAPASAQAAVPQPRPEEWWFTTWSIQERVWPITKGDGVIVAVADSGVNASLPEFNGVLLPGSDATGHGSDGRSDTDTTPDPLGKGGFGHGTGMASLIAAQGGGTGMVGLAPEARVLPVVANQDDEYATAIRWAADHGAKVINVSAGWTNGYGPGRCPKAYEEAIDHALHRDVVVVAGSGNDGDIGVTTVPGGCVGVLTVGAVDHRLQPWKDSTPQPSVDVAAPGVDIASIDRNGRLGKGNGTSSSTALTSAVVALVRAKYPRMSARQVVQRIIATAKDVGPKGRDDQTGYGVVNPHRALAADVPADSPNPVFAEWDRQQQGRSTPTVSPAAAPVSDGDTSAVFDAETLVMTGAGLAVSATLIGGGVLFLRRERSTRG